jgi:hypothetical protein
MNRRSAVVVLLVIVALLSFGPTCLSNISVAERGMWPGSWPKELEPYREQALTIEMFGSPGAHETCYDIQFDSREEFEKAWPHILTLSSKGAPLTLVKGPLAPRG